MLLILLHIDSVFFDLVAEGVDWDPGIIH